MLLLADRRRRRRPRHRRLDERRASQGCGERRSLMNRRGADRKAATRNKPRRLDGWTKPCGDVSWRRLAAEATSQSRDLLFATTLVAMTTMIKTGARDADINQSTLLRRLRRRQLWRRRRLSHRSTSSYIDQVDDEEKNTRLVTDHQQKQAKSGRIADSTIHTTSTRSPARDESCCVARDEA